MQHRHDNLVASLDYAHIHKSVIDVRARLAASYPVVKHSKCNKLKVSRIQEKIMIFLVATKTLLVRVPFVKVSILQTIFLYTIQQFEILQTNVNKQSFCRADANILSVATKELLIFLHVRYNSRIAVFWELE